MRLGASITLGAVAIAGCSGAAKSREDFVTRVAAGEGSTVHEQYAVPRPLADVQQTLHEKNAECFGKTVYKDGAGPAPGSRSTSSATYLAWLKQAPDATVQLTLLVRYSPRPVPSPEEGIYYLAADLREQGGATSVDLYAPTRVFDHIAEAVRGWIKGDPVSCPELR